MDKICAYKINGTPVNNTNGYNTEELGGNPPFIFLKESEVVPVEYKNITSIENFEKYGKLAGIDFKLIRKLIGQLVVDLGWETLSTTEKEIASRYFAVDFTKQLEVYDMDTLMDMGVDYHKESIDTRRNRIIVAEARIYTHMDIQDAFTLITTMEDLATRYVKWGLEGKESGDSMDGLFDYLTSNASSVYNGAGLMESGLPTKTGITLQMLSDILMEVLRDGYY